MKNFAEVLTRLAIQDHALNMDMLGVQIVYWASALGTEGSAVGTYVSAPVGQISIVDLEGAPCKIKQTLSCCQEV